MNLQMETIPKSFTHRTEESKKQKAPQSTSYWKGAYELIDIELAESNTSLYRRCDEFWVDVSKNYYCRVLL